MSNPDSDTQVERQTAFQIVDRIARGSVSDRLTSRLASVAQAVQMTGKKGKVVLTLTVEPNDAEHNAVTIDTKVAATVPEHEYSGLFFLDSHGQLSRSNPDAALPGMSDIG